MNWNRAALVFWWIVLAAAVAVSVKGNVQHAAAVASFEYRFMAELVAGGLPIALFVMIEGVALGSLGGAHGNARKLGLALTAALAMVVFSMSYVGLLNCIQHMGLTGLVWLERALALCPDLLMIAATAYLMSLRGVAAKVEKSSTESRWRRLADAATRRAEAALAISEIPQVDTLTEARGATAEGLTAAPQTSAETFVEDFAEPPSAAMEPFAEPPVPSPEHSAKPAAKAPSTSTKPAAKAVDAELLPFMDAAEEMESAGLVRGKSAADYAKVIAAVEQRWSPNRIKKELGYSTSTTEKVRHAWHERQRADQRQLSAVG